ncbi:putative nuclease HARBI1 [Dendroctonus ponderosae]|uniref:putative nuclease HARBI1 n=1 Tax=Dendroctonus ponderosae TaxID=77166 RepID=UPI002034E263|nr:putative nuclease HARBI1 [Dendroctonus ponderosae]KAH1025096.1 hypothetical protein HUJ05_009891 [Dendroctonus ponderosae]
MFDFLKLKQRSCQQSKHFMELQGFLMSSVQLIARMFASNHLVEMRQNDIEINRKGYFSWNVQAVCDARLRFTDIVVRWPGSSHDQTIFNNRDGGYGNSNFLLTPLRQPSTAAESLYNESHIRSRNCIERAFGVWKRRFPVLSLGMRLSQERSQAVIVATTVLHNLAIEERDGDPPSEVDDNNALEENVHSIQQSFF